MSAARKPALVSACDELGRIGALAIDLAPVFAGEFRAQRPHRLADRRQARLVGGALAHALISARPLLIATTLRSGTERAEAHDIAVAPDFGADGFARKHRRGKPPAHGGDAAGIVVADAFQQRMADHAEGAEPVQDRPREARGLGHLEIDVQRIEVGGQPIDQRHAPAACRDRRRDRARARAILCTGGLSRGGPPKPPSARQNVVCVTVAISAPLALSVTLRSV